MSRPENDKETEKEKKNRVNDSELARILTSFLSHWLTFFLYHFPKPLETFLRLGFPVWKRVIIYIRDWKRYHRASRTFTYPDNLLREDLNKGFIYPIPIIYPDDALPFFFEQERLSFPHTRPIYYSPVLNL